MKDSKQFLTDVQAVVPEIKNNVRTFVHPTRSIMDDPGYAAFLHITNLINTYGPYVVEDAYRTAIKAQIDD